MGEGLLTSHAVCSWGEGGFSVDDVEVVLLSCLFGCLAVEFYLMYLRIVMKTQRPFDFIEGLGVLSASLMRFARRKRTSKSLSFIFFCIGDYLI